MLKHLKYASILGLSALAVACGSSGSGTAKTPDNTKVDLSDSPKGLVDIKTADGALIGYNQDYSFYGVWVNDEKTKQEIRHQGIKTPTTKLLKGSVTYTGHAVRARDNIIAQNVDGVQTDGKTTLNVNFDTKKVSGKIEMPLARDITLHETNLDGSSFDGKASVLLNDSGKYTGALYGLKAEEAAGTVTFENNPALNTSFGGKR